MRRRPSSGTTAGEVDRQLDDTAYDSVVVVKDSIVAVNTVANAITAGSFNIVETNILDVNVVAGHMANIDIVAADVVNIDAVAANKINIDTVALNNANITIVATHMASVDEVAVHTADVVSVATNMAEILLADTNAATATAQALIAINAANSAIVSSIITSAYGNINWAGFQVTDGELWVEYFNSSTSTPSVVDGEFILTY